MIDLKTIRYSKYVFGLWCVLGLWIVWQAGSAVARSAVLPAQVRKALAQHAEASKGDTPSASEESQQAAAVKNPFAPPPQYREMQCTAILGQEALIDGKWYKVGDTVNGSKIVEIQPISVKIRWQEEDHILVPFNVPVQYSSNKTPPSPQAGPPGQNSVTPTAPPSQSMSSGPSTRFPNGGSPGGFMPSEEQRRQMYERYQNATPEERAEMRQQMRERFGGRRSRRED